MNWRKTVFRRVLRIQRVLVRYGLDDVITATHLLRPLRFLFYLSYATPPHRSLLRSVNAFGSRSRNSARSS